MRHSLPFAAFGVIALFVAMTPAVASAGKHDWLAAMVAAGHYDWADENVNAKRFPVSPEDPPESFLTTGLKVIPIDRFMTSVEVEAKLRKDGYEPAAIEQLLLWGASHPEDQRHGPIVALGSSTLYSGDSAVAPPGGDWYVPYLSADAGKRFVALDWNGPGNHWAPIVRFLARPITKR